MRRPSKEWWLVAVVLAVLTGLVLATRPRAPRAPTEAGIQGAATTWIYQEQLESPWLDYSWAQHSLSATDPVASGAHAISVTLGPWEALYFAHPGLDVAPGDTLVLKVHGGSEGEGAAVRVRAVVGDAQPVGLPLGPTCEGGAIHAGRWSTCRVPLALLLPEGQTRITGLWLQEDNGNTLPPLFFDDLGVEHSEAPPEDVRVTVSPPDAVLAPGGSRAFTATVSGSDDTSVDWSVEPPGAGGVITVDGVYTAPSEPGTYHVVARSRAAPEQVARAAIHVRTEGMPGEGKWVSGYYTGWNTDLYPPEKVDFSAITHLMVGRATPRADGTLNTQFDNDQGPEIARALSKRAHEAGRKAIIMVGGAGEHDGWVGAASDANRATFVRSLLQAVDDFGYDGLDLDWEPVEKEDQPKLLALVQALRAERPELVLTFPLHWINTNFPQDADPWFARLAPYLDQVNVMSYEMIGPWEGWHSWHTSALRGETPEHPTSVASTLDLWVKAGIPKEKLGLGIPFYGMAWRHITGPGQPFTGGSDYVGGDNVFTYKKVLALSEKGTEQWDDAARASYVTFAQDACVEDGTVRWISHESPRSIAEKGQFAKEEGYGGVIIWTVNQGCTDPETGANPLLDAVRDAFLE
ncbi:MULTISPECIES: glycosyl hydrolase family 18 protein [unclassified Corallococcus]|uniref:glycosyl hydrolase family 18 protein n=1 Tax=unclassified Corallococcus TaxID=2685029 RepID=UPI001A8C1678|nr:MULTISPECIES: glycosyl hydrolase family 18 protein [unclassified Corallococcus]MBN9683686.1 chitinase [Corallococcus sp. NCSPR001]WAS84806.1 glycosyl hydrolase family 18 protein [Corallococcus sp. NCRR]